MRFSTFLYSPLLFVFLAAVLAWAPVSKTKRSAKWAVSGNSSLQVLGSTNVNKFTCGISSYKRFDTLEITETKNAVALTGSLNLSLENFDCRNPVMTRDLRKTLKSDQYPDLCITFLNLSKMPTLRQKPEAITGWVDIELAGTRKRVEVNYQISVDAQGLVHVDGTRDITFADFNLTPPTKFNRMVQTRQKLTISFSLQLKAVG
ncbi:YceI family protein [Rufibacter sp. LB8]|uniref:YceI family protein n=1 Tax=Rufibacter sp. LB8 TaxID=2777781 RepID=UPI00178C6098|nr:YceI family protein [Rufibacter sp. LB8]